MSYLLHFGWDQLPQPQLWWKELQNSKTEKVKSTNVHELYAVMCTRTCCVLMSTPDNQQPKPG